MKLKARTERKQRRDEMEKADGVLKHRFDKKQVNMKAAEGEGTLELVGASFTPSDSQLTAINKYTRKEVGADDVVAFTTMSCNDMFDRDDERFTTDTVEEFAALPEPYSPNGKSYMVDHEYKMANAKGRIFETGTETVDGVKFLTNGVYVPKTEQYKNFIEALDFGIAWAVSVGVVIDKANCTIPGCGAQVFNSRFFGSWCAEGHEKGYFYVPGEEEDDGWGFFEPVDPETKGAVKAQVDLSDPIDFYELSQVFLGAQYMAELAKKPNFSRMLKAASVSTVPVFSVSHKDAEELPIPEEPAEVAEARQNYTVTINDAGDPTWTDEQGLVWVYQAIGDNYEVMCLGKAENDGSQEPGEAVGPDGDQDPSGEDVAGSVAGPEHGEEHPEPEAGSADAAAGQRLTEPSDEDKEKTVSKKALVTALRAAKIPATLVDKVEEVEGDDLTVLLSVVSEHISTTDKQVADLTSKATLGDAYLKNLRGDALAWYVKARQTEPNQAVSTESFSKLLDRCEDDVDLLRDIIEEQKSIAKARFGDAVRRSSFEDDANNVQPPALDEEATGTSEADKKSKFVQRIHR